MKCGILGYGIIGQATHIGLLNNRSVAIHDINLDTRLEALADCDIVFYCIPTTDNADVEKLIDITVRLTTLNAALMSVYRSTVPVGTCRQIKETYNIDIYYMPEFLRERMWETECRKPEIIVGQQDNFDFASIWPDKKFVCCSWADAEMVKMFSNNFAALRVTFANHMYDLAQTANSDYNKVLSLWQLIENKQTYLDVSENLRGFGGKCLPKDLDFLQVV